MYISCVSFHFRSSLSISPTKTVRFSLCSVDEVEQVLKTSSRAPCRLDPSPTSILHELPCLVIIISNTVNVSLSAGHFPLHLKSLIVKLPLEKSTFDPDNCENYRPVSSSSFISKVIEKVNQSTTRAHIRQ